MLKLKTGHIATVTLQNSRFTKNQGRVEEVGSDHEDGPIGLSFPGYCRYLFDDRSYGKIGTIVYFEESELRKNGRDDPQDIDLDQLCDILFGRSMWSCREIYDRPLMIGFTKCEGCDKTVVARILVNNHGTVSEIDVCKDHLEYHGRNCDGFPFKKSKEVGV